jgi:hypothetical protein
MQGRSNRQCSSFGSIFRRPELIRLRLNSLLNANKIHYDFQFRFKPNHSTSLALTAPIDNNKYLLDDKDFTAGIYLELQKAYDTVSYEILMHKSFIYGVRA